MRASLLIVLLAVTCISCNQVSQQEINEDVTELVKIEREILDLTLEIQKDKNQRLVRKRDSLGDELQNLSNKYQQKYYKLEKTEEFQEAYKKIKEKHFRKK